MGDSTPDQVSQTGSLWSQVDSRADRQRQISSEILGICTLSRKVRKDNSGRKFLVFKNLLTKLSFRQGIETS
jgi:hypothetical protein